MNSKKILKDFFISYLDLPRPQPKIVSLGGGRGLSTLLSGLKKHPVFLTAIVTMADEGGSAGRLRRLLGVPPFGDFRDCLAALANNEETMTKLLAYRFKGERYQRDDALGGHSFGNLFLTALTDITGDFEKALEEASKILNIKGLILPSTREDVHIWAETDSGQKVYGEENIDLGKYNGNRTIKKLHLDPPSAKGYEKAIAAIENAGIITAGPGDLYTSIMPNLLISDITHALLRSKAKKVFIVNIANKPFETPQYAVSDYIKALISHAGSPIFTHFVVNNNQSAQIPDNLKYTYVTYDENTCNKLAVSVLPCDIVDDKFPLHHDSRKLADIIMNLLKL